MSLKARLYLLAPSNDESTKTMCGYDYHKRPLKVFVDARPAVFKFVQNVEFKQAGDLKPKTKALEGFFVRTGQDDYRQLGPSEVNKLFAWMANHNLKPKDMTTDQVDTALKTPTIVPVSTKVENPHANEKISEGGIILP